MSYSDKERYENEERSEVQKQILLDIAKRLPVYTRAASGATVTLTGSGSMLILLYFYFNCRVNNCIGFSNYKFFLLFLTYAMVYCVFIASTVLQYFIKFWACSGLFMFSKGSCAVVGASSIKPCSSVIDSYSLFSAVRFCDRCQVIKPDRCHHCSLCEMVNNCIGFSNYKFFLLFLTYAMVYCVFIASTVLQYFIKFWAGELPNGHAKFHVLFLLFVALMFFVSLLFLFGYHCWLVAKNRSTLEAFQYPTFHNGPDKNGFNLGFSKNLQQVFGEDRKYWFIPTFTSLGDGHFFPMRFLSESRNPLLASVEQCEDGGSDEENYSKIISLTL
ncbi:UNVERIFIED_CONTAM: hypothetical protein FKN15_039086 [Acipenser sinensis]